MDPDPNPKFKNQGLDPVLILLFFLYCTVCSNFSNIFSLFKNSYPRSETVCFYGSGYWKDTGSGSCNLNKSLPEIGKRSINWFVQYKNIASHKEQPCVKKIMTEVLIPTCCLSKKFRLLVTNVFRYYSIINLSSKIFRAVKKANIFVYIRNLD